MKTGFFNRIKKYFTHKYSQKNESIFEKEEKSGDFEYELRSLKEKLNHFLLSRKKDFGVIIERKNYKATKIASRIFKLEGTDPAGNFAVLFSTGSYLTRKDANIQGLIQVNEASFNRILQREHSGISSMLDLAGVSNVNGVTLLNIPAKKDTHWEEVCTWKKVWQYQVFSRLRPNYLALLLASYDERFETLFLENTTSRMKSIVRDELYYLNRMGNDGENYPHSKNFSIYDFEKAELELSKILEEIEAKREKEI